MGAGDADRGLPRGRRGGRDSGCRLLGRLLGLRAHIDGDGWPALDALGAGGPALRFQPVPESKTAPNRLHLDVHVDDLDAATRLVLRSGGRAVTPVRDGGGLPWRVVADPEGNELCLLTRPATPPATETVLSISAAEV